MNIDNILKKLKEQNKYIAINKTNTIYNLKNRNLMVIESTSNTFSITRSAFERLIQAYNYAYLLINKNTNELFYFDNKKDWMKLSFERSNKEELFFGKEILQTRISIDDIKIKVM